MVKELDIRHQTSDMGRKIFVFCLLFFVCCLVICSCSPRMYKDTFVISETYLEVISPYKDAGSIVYGEFQRLDKIFNFYDADSEIARLNNSDSTVFNASDELIGLLKLSQEISHQTNGVFDITGGALFSFWKSLMNDGGIKSFPREEEVALVKQNCGWENIEIDFENKTVLIKKTGVKIDLSAIAKGYMVDSATRQLKSEGIDSALINAGGDIYCLGRNGKELWKVGVQHPLKKRGIIRKETIENKAIATSGGYERFFEFEGRKYSHLIDVRSGLPVQNSILSVSVVSNNCALADSLATAFFVMGFDEIKQFMSKGVFEGKVIVVVEEGKLEQKVYEFIGEKPMVI